MRAGVIDIGSNSIKLSIGEVAGEDIKMLEFLKNVVPIGRSTFFKGSISQEAINQTIVILEKYQEKLREYEVSNVSVIATTAIREARNSDIFIDTIYRKTGLKIEVLASGDVVYYIDSYLSYKLKNTYPLHDKNIMIVELGTGSLDVSVMRKGFTVMNTSLSIGTLRLKQLLDKLEGSDEENYEAIREYIENEFLYLKRSIPSINIDDIILIDENYAPYLPQLIAKERTDTKFYQLEKKEVEEIVSQVADKNKEEIARAYKIPLQMAETITPYSIIVNNLFVLTESKYLYIFETSLAEAVLANMMLDIEIAKKYDKTNQLISMARFICQKHNVDLDHAKQVAALSRTLFDSFKDFFGLQEKDSIYLILAAYLHDIGMFINNRSHHKHTEYILSFLNLFRMTTEEMKMIACTARYHRKAMPSNDHILYNTLPLERRILVQKLSVILRLANALDRGHKRKVKKIEVVFTKEGDINVVVYTQHNFILEQAEFLNNKSIFEEITGNKINLLVKYEV